MTQKRKLTKFERNIKKEMDQIQRRQVKIQALIEKRQEGQP